MNKKGFTLVEVITAIVIMALIVGLAIPAVIAIQNRTRTRMYCAKVLLIEQAAVNWAGDNRNILRANGNIIENFTIGELLDENYLKADRDHYIIDPRDSDSMNEVRITVWIQNKRIHAKIVSAIPICEGDIVFTPIPDDSDSGPNQPERISLIETGIELSFHCVTHTNPCTLRPGERFTVGIHISNPNMVEIGSFERLGVVFDSTKVLWDYSGTYHPVTNTPIRVGSAISPMTFIPPANIYADSSMNPTDDLNALFSFAINNVPFTNTGVILELDLIITDNAPAGPVFFEVSMGPLYLWVE